MRQQYCDRGCTQHLIEGCRGYSEPWSGPLPPGHDACALQAHDADTRIGDMPDLVLSRPIRAVTMRPRYHLLSLKLNEIVPTTRTGAPETTVGANNHCRAALTAVSTRSE